MNTTRHSPLSGWDASAGVRSGERRVLETSVPADTVYFPDQMVAHLSHPLIAQLPAGTRENLRLYQLYQFLLSTTHMETRMVNAAAEQIAHARCGLEIPTPMRLDAFRVYCDEGYHALYSLDLADQIAAATDVAIPAWDFGGFIDRLGEHGARLVPDGRTLALLLQTVIFETLITAVLNEAPSDPRLHPTVRTVLRDHARDEGRHHRFFGEFFHQLWAGLDAPQRGRVARALPALIMLCLEADVAPVAQALRSAGLTAPDAQQVIEDCYRAPSTARAAQMARGTLAVFRSAGVLDVAGAPEAFADAGLLTE